MDIMRIRVEYVRGKNEERMTPSQRKAVARIRQEADAYCGKVGHILTRFDVTEFEKFTAISITTSPPNIADSFERQMRSHYAHLFIGTHGGITYPVNVDKHGGYKQGEKHYVDLEHTMYPYCLAR